MAFVSDIKIVSGASEGIGHSGGGLRFGSGTINGQPLRVLDLSTSGLNNPVKPITTNGAAIVLPDSEIIAEETKKKINNLLGIDLEKWLLILSSVLIVSIFAKIFRN